MACDIFVSYKRKNKGKVLKIVEMIERIVGVKCWIDLTGVETSSQFASKICNAIDKSSVVLFMHSKEHLTIDYEEDYTIKEITYAKKKGKKIILIKLDNSPLDNIFLFEFGAKDYIEANQAYQLQKLTDDLNKFLHRENGSSHDPYTKAVIMFERGQYREAYMTFLELAQKGHRDAQYYLGLCYSQGKGVRRNLEAAGRWFQKADSASTKSEHITLSHEAFVQFYKAVEMFKENRYREAYRIFYELALNGHRDSQYYVGLCYSLGKGVNRNLEVAQEWFQRAEQEK